MTQVHSVDTHHPDARAARHGAPRGTQEGARDARSAEQQAAPLSPCRPEGKLYE